MMTVHNEHSPQHEEVQKKHILEQSEVTQVLDFLKQYGKLIGAGILAAIIMVLASTIYAQAKTNKIAKAEELLMNAKTPQEIEEVVNNYSSTPTAPVALLSLAKTSFNDGDVAQAREYYNQFIKKYKKNDLRPTADFGLAHCTEAEGNFDAAATEFAEFIMNNPDHYLTAPAILGQARSLGQAQKTEDARILLEDFLAKNETSPWAGPADAALQQLAD